MPNTEMVSLSRDIMRSARDFTLSMNSSIKPGLSVQIKQKVYRNLKGTLTISIFLFEMINYLLDSALSNVTKYSCLDSRCWAWRSVSTKIGSEKTI